jgi:hypothetical protein
MLYRLKFDTIIRIYDDCVYITSKSDFGDCERRGADAP